MRPLICKAFLLVLVLAIGPPLAGAGPEMFGEFEVTDFAIDTGIIMFDTTANPLPFPNPSAIQQAATYPALGAGDMTVGDIQAFLDGAGLPNDTIGYCWELAPNGTVGIASLVITIGGRPAAVSDGELIIISEEPVNTVTYFIADGLDLDDFDTDDKVLFSYNTFLGTADIVKVNLAATPEPISMLLLGTGFAGLMMIRLRRKRQ
jgi:hypothetical protein